MVRFFVDYVILISALLSALKNFHYNDEQNDSMGHYVSEINNNRKLDSGITVVARME